MNLLQKTTWKRFAPDWLTFLSGVLIVFSFPPWNLWPLIWICLVPWFIALKRAPSLKDAALQGVWLSYLVSLGGFHWVAFVLKEFGGLPWTVSVFGLQLFCFFGQPQFVAFAILFWTFGQKKRDLHPVLGSLLFAFAYTGIDWFSPKLFMDTLGHSFYLARHLRQLADLGGPPLLTFLIFLTNDTLWGAWENWSRTRKLRFSAQLAFALSVILLGWIYGFVRYKQVTEAVSQSQRGFQVAAIQANIGDFDKIASESGVRGAALKVVQTFTELSDKAMQMQPRPDFVIWPETSYPSTFRNPHSSTELQLDQYVEEYARKIGVPLLFGGYDHQGTHDFNAFFFLSPDGKLQVYRKNILLLFGEYIPGAESIQLIRESFPQVGNFGRGPGPQAIPIQTPAGVIHAGPIICYEALFTNYIAEAAQKGSQFLINITNDSWFGTWGEPQLHLALTTFRSVETHLPMVRATNTGISTLISADGEITHPTEIGVADIMNLRVPITDPIPTLIKLWGDWFGPFSLGTGFMGILALWLQSRKRTSKVQI
jgi:apolipoprotein N-acyltransferase